MVPSRALIQAFGITPCLGIEYQHRFSHYMGFPFHCFHQLLCDATPTRATMHKHLGDIGAVRLIVRLGHNQLDRADRLALMIFSHEQDAFATGDTIGNV